MSFFHQCAVGFFEPTSLVIGKVLRVSRPLERGAVEAIAEEYLRNESPAGDRPPMWWEDDGYIVVEHIAIRTIASRVAFVHAVMSRTGCDAVEVLGRTVRSAPWPRIKPPPP